MCYLLRPRDGGEGRMKKFFVQSYVPYHYNHSCVVLLKRGEHPVVNNVDPPCVRRKLFR